MSLRLFKGQKGEVALKLDTAEDRISAYMLNKLPEDKLHKKDQHLLSRWLQVWGLLAEDRTPTEAVNEHLNKCKIQGGEISLRTAWSDLQRATRIWGNLNDIDYRATLVLLKDWATRSFRMALKDRNTRDMNAAIKEMREIAAQLHAITDIGDDGGVTPSTFVLAVQMVDGGIKTFDLDNHTDTPEEITRLILDSRRENYMDPEEFIDFTEVDNGADKE